MNTPPLVNEIHLVREACAQRYNNDLKAICEAAQRRQGQSGRPVVYFSPKPLQTESLLLAKAA